MKIRLTILVLVGVFLFNGCASIPGPAPKKSGNIYRYDKAPDIFFFPKARAKWDGYKITNKNWSQLSDYQKFMFILEGIKELEINEAVLIRINDSARTILALNYGVDRINKEMPKTEISMISFMYGVFRDAKMVIPSKSRVTKKNRL